MKSRQRLLAEREAADVLGLSPRTLQDWRRRSEGPAYLKMGKRIAYRIEDLEEFMDRSHIIPKGGAHGRR